MRSMSCQLIPTGLPMWLIFGDFANFKSLRRCKMHKLFNNYLGIAMVYHGIAFQEPSLRVGQEGHHPRFPHYRAGCDFSSNLITMPCAFGDNWLEIIVLTQFSNVISRISHENQDLLTQFLGLQASDQKKEIQ